MISPLEMEINGKASIECIENPRGESCIHHVLKISQPIFYLKYSLKPLEHVPTAVDCCEILHHLVDGSQVPFIVTNWCKISQPSTVLTMFQLRKATLTTLPAW
jgi:hypothetical protein